MIYYFATSLEGLKETT